MNSKKEIILKIDYSSFDTISEFLALLEVAGIEIVSLSNDEYIVKL